MKAVNKVLYDGKIFMPGDDVIAPQNVLKMLLASGDIRKPIKEDDLAADKKASIPKPPGTG